MRVEKENTKLKKKLEELRLVDRAKCMLIAYEGMSETQAHRHIEKQAMTHGVQEKPWQNIF